MKISLIIDYGLYISDDNLQGYDGTGVVDFISATESVGNYYSGAEGECCDVETSDYKFTVDERFVILPLSRFPALFEQRYRDKDEAIQELRENYADYLPIDFDYETHFVKVTGIMYA